MPQPSWASAGANRIEGCLFGNGERTVVIDAYAGAVVGWEASASKQTRFVESAIRQTVALRSRQDHPWREPSITAMPVPAGSQYTSLKFSETLTLSGIRPSVGTAMTAAHSY